MALKLEQQPTCLPELPKDRLAAGEGPGVPTTASTHHNPGRSGISSPLLYLSPCPIYLYRPIFFSFYLIFKLCLPAKWEFKSKMWVGQQLTFQVPLFNSQVKNVNLNHQNHISDLINPHPARQSPSQHPAHWAAGELSMWIRVQGL